MRIPILTGVQNGRKSRRKSNSYFAKNVSFLRFISETNVTSIPTACFIFWPFILNVFFQFFSRGIHMHVRILARVQNERISLQKTVKYL